MIKEVSTGSARIGFEPVSVSKTAAAIEPGKLAKLSAELSVLIGRGGTVGGVALTTLAGSDPLSAVGERSSLEREYLRKWLPPVAMRFGLSLAFVLSVLLGGLLLSLAVA